MNFLIKRYQINVEGESLGLIDIKIMKAKNWDAVESYIFKRIVKLESYDIFEWENVGNFSEQEGKKLGNIWWQEDEAESCQY